MEDEQEIRERIGKMPGTPVLVAVGWHFPVVSELDFRESETMLPKAKAWRGYGLQFTITLSTDGPSVRAALESRVTQ